MNKCELYLKPYDSTSAVEVPQGVYDLVLDQDKTIDSLQKENQELRRKFEDFKLKCDAESDRDTQKIKELKRKINLAVEALKMFTESDQIDGIVIAECMARKALKEIKEQEK